MSRRRTHRRRTHKRRNLFVALLVVVGAAAVLMFPLPQSWRAVTHIVNEVTIAQPDTVVFEYVSTPANWPNWHPSSLAVTGAAAGHSLLAGEQVTETFSVAGRRGQVVWTAVERIPPSDWMIQGTIDGRAAGAVRYTLAQTPEGTHFRREFTYAAPNLLFALTNWLLLRKRIEAESSEAVTRLRAVLEARMPSPGAGD
ncbi:SRPBCC family protein [Cupriavidus basilensis]|uniref:SRPBCC family protein n=1 Tax=Cupriavidus basilensis TaxID=68895 RepID=UPI000A2F2F8D|nr:SRPBCC family protein [Cupriavidus basilensis]